MSKHDQMSDGSDNEGNPRSTMMHEDEIVCESMFEFLEREEDRAWSFYRSRLLWARFAEINSGIQDWDRGLFFLRCDKSKGIRQAELLLVVFQMFENDEVRGRANVTATEPPTPIFACALTALALQDHMDGAQFEVDSERDVLRGLSKTFARQLASQESFELSLDAKKEWVKLTMNYMEREADGFSALTFEAVDTKRCSDFFIHFMMDSAFAMMSSSKREQQHQSWFLAEKSENKEKKSFEYMMASSISNTSPTKRKKKQSITSSQGKDDDADRFERQRILSQGISQTPEIQDGQDEEASPMRSSKPKKKVKRERTASNQDLSSGTSPSRGAAAQESEIAKPRKRVKTGKRAKPRGFTAAE